MFFVVYLPNIYASKQAIKQNITLSYQVSD